MNSFDINKIFCPVCENGLIEYIPPMKETVRTVGNVDNYRVAERQYICGCIKCGKKWSNAEVVCDVKGNITKFKLID